MTSFRFLPICLALWIASSGVRGEVVINEILYHPPGEADALQFVELHNPDSQGTDLSGWRFTKGIRFAFPSGSRLEAGGYLVVCRDRERFQEAYAGVPVAGVFDGALKRGGERIELEDGAGRVVDSVRFRDDPPWPAGADGQSGSLERITPGASSEDPWNWIASPLADDRERPMGTPGRVNAGYSGSLPPVIRSMSRSPEFPAPGQPIRVEAALSDAADVAGVEVVYRVTGSDAEGGEVTVPMEHRGGARYEASVPGQTEGSLVRIQVQARGRSGGLRRLPASTEPVPALSSHVRAAVPTAAIPLAWLIHTGEGERAAAKTRLASAARPAFGPFGGMPFPPPDPEEEDRRAARGRMVEVLDLSPIWFALTVDSDAVDPARLERLREPFVQAIRSREALMQEMLDGPGVAGRMEGFPDRARTFLRGLAEAVAGHVSVERQRAVDAVIDEHLGGVDSGARMILSRVDLEGVWYALTVGTGLPADQVRTVGAAVVQLDRERRGLLSEVASGVGRANLFRDQRVRAEALGDRIASVLEPLLGSAGRDAVGAWVRGPRESVVGFRPDRPRPGPPGGPPGFGGPPPFAFGPGRGFGGDEEGSPGPFRSALVYFDPATGTSQLFDFVQVSGRKGGRKVHLPKGRTLDGMTTINLIHEGETESLVEPLAYEVYRRAGMPVERSFHVRLWEDGQPAGYQVLVEQPNRSFLRNAGLDDGGHLYKLIWYGDGLEGQHEKKTRIAEGHAALSAVVARLEATTGDEQWEVIRRNFDVGEVATYFAVNLVLSHWDGFFNNYFAYHDSEGTGKWTLYPWDQDSTWGLRVMGRPGAVFYDMPVTFGMNGDQPPDDAFWWRGPGWFSGPLLANPRFRAVYLARVREILETVYTEAVFGPVLDALGARLEPEVRLRAEILGRDPAAAVEGLRGDLDRCRRHLRLRREYLLAQEAVRGAAGRPGDVPSPR